MSDTLILDNEKIDSTIKSHLDQIPKLLNKIDAIINTYWKDSHDSDSIMVANQAAMVGKILEINANMLHDFATTYKMIDEPAIPAMFARGAFELHLIFSEALSNSKKFVNMLIKAADSYQLFTENFLKIAERKGDKKNIGILVDELTRIGLLRRKYAKLIGLDLGTGSKPNPYYSFYELAKNYGYLEEYRFEYDILSCFIHPALLQIMTTDPRGGTASEEKQKLMRDNVQRRKEMVKTIAINVLLGMSSKTINKTKEFIENLEKK